MHILLLLFLSDLFFHAFIDNTLHHLCFTQSTTRCLQCSLTFLTVFDISWSRRKNYGRVLYFYINDVFYLCKCDKSLEGGNEYFGYKVKSSLVNWFFICFITLEGIVLAWTYFSLNLLPLILCFGRMYPLSFNHK